jgi:hypothetical protein
MESEKIEVRATDSDNTLQVVVLTKRANRIEVVLGEGVHSVKCVLTPTSNRLAYAGTAMGREIVYERTPEQVQADLDRLNPHINKPRRR